MFAKYLFVFLLCLVLYLIHVAESRNDLDGQYLISNESGQTHLRVKRTFSDKFWELKMHEFDALLSLKIWKLKMIWWYIIWVKRIWLRIISQMLKHVGIELTEEDIRGPFPPYEQSFTNEFMQSNSLNSLKMMSRGKRSDDLLSQPTAWKFWRRVKERKRQRALLHRLRGEASRRQKTPSVMNTFKYDGQNDLASELIKTKASSFAKFAPKLLNYMGKTGEASCEYKEICEMSSFIASTTPPSMMRFISSDMDLIGLIQNLDFENKYVEAITVGLMQMNCHNYYKDIC